MDKSSLGWNKTCVWICTKCKKGTTIAEDAKMDFKTRLREEGLNHSIRVMTSSCLGLCPENRQAVVIVSPDGGALPLECDWPEDREILFQEIKKHKT